MSMFETWTQYPSTTLAGLYRQLYQARLFEETLYFLFLEGKVPGSLHQSQGQEAVSVGVCSLLNKDDVVYSTHRPHSDYLAKGADMTRLIAEILGRQGGCCKGKGGSMHICDLGVGAMPAVAIVGGTQQVAVSFTGDGAANEGAWHEALNMAALYDLPALFVIINNQWASSTPFRQSVKIERLSDRAASYGMPGMTVDGMDVLAVREATDSALRRARGGKGPTLLECVCYRFAGHSRSDPANYRPRQEVEDWKLHDPVTTMRAKLVESGSLSENEVAALEGQVKAEIDAAVAEAERSPVPAPEECLDDVYA
jgi:TPP-dependent pyruvate/acetoin dehydrogenase alpha subunit